MERMAYGFRDMEFFKLKIMAIRETKYALVGWTFFIPLNDHADQPD